jgi:hypothetical protein
MYGAYVLYNERGVRWAYQPKEVLSFMLARLWFTQGKLVMSMYTGWQAL